jgi:transposase InsO family protein
MAQTKGLTVSDLYSGSKEHWFLNLRHARSIIAAWRKEYNEERPKKGLGGLTPSQYARRLATKSDTVTARLQIRVLPKTG